MEMEKIEEIQGLRDARLLDALTVIWNESVRTIHRFLSECDIGHIKPYVAMVLRKVEHLVVVYQNKQPKGFMGIQDDKIKMLFLAPDYIGKRWGSYLTDLAIHTYGVTKVDVNERNKQTTRFYEHKGFQVLGRDELDKQGNPFPILHLKPSETTHILTITKNKKQYLDLLLLGDEQESMIDRYLDRGEMFAMFTTEQAAPIGVAVVTNENEGICELKNIAIAPNFQHRGFGMKMVDHLCQHYKHQFQTMQVGTGDSRQTTSFYQRCGFNYSHTIDNFFSDNYDHPIVEDGKVLKDMIYFRKQLK